ncbi:putative protocadherin Fat 4 [Apostichopus japonicus]|uniref:Putative protocadherin Fat 4 n=1 Tax=Stichopus japonicus TaxID=307972 RepID=A0A2G8KVM6_STIJA|nr:putative protocadherin Fat 4 [Apostichopus japonicus]
MGAILVNIAITDVNDNPPVFQNVMYNTSVVEGANQDTRVLTVSATDADSTSADITYSIISGGDNRFVIGPTDGRITVAGALDRETKAGYTVTVRASDGSLSSTATVAISVLDVNDNSPIFTEVVYSFTLPEDTIAPSVVDRVLATDLDEGSNGEVRYQIVEEGAPGEAIFDLNPLTGELMLVQAVDFEVKQLYYLKIRSTDQGQPPLTSVSVIYINVLDVNDNSPSFSHEPDIVEVREDADIGFQLVTVLATDQDSGPNGAIQYTIQSGDPTGRFTILANGTVVVERPLDRETQSFYNLEVRGEDMAEDPQDRRFSTTQVPVILVDVNDNDPVFISPPEIHVLESAAPGSFVMKVIAEDLDVARNSYIEYKFEPALEDESF